MKTHAIIPVFIPHEGCPHDCVFCNQKKITAREKAPDEAETTELIEKHLAQLRRNPNITEIEIAFYGGSFTGIPLKDQAMYLALAKKYKDSGQIRQIHLSTRPDYIDDEILDQLQYYGTDIVELGVQSFDEEVLRLSGRGHSREVIYQSARMIKERGMTLGIQLMVGLPGDSYEKCMKSVEETIKIGPAIARIYPTVVLKETALYEMYLQNRYEPLKEEDAVNTVKDMMRSLKSAGIDIIRVGLKSSDNITMNGGAVAAGSYHPAFRQLAESALAREEIEALLLGELRSAAVRLSADAASCIAGIFGRNRRAGKACRDRRDGRDGKDCKAGRDVRSGRGGESCGDLAGLRTAVRDQGREKQCGTVERFAGFRTTLRDQGGQRRLKVTFYSAPESFSNLVGLKRANKSYFFEKYPELNLKFAVDRTLQRNKYRVSVE